ncbi:anaphase-promoting complex, cyclosome, subunit 4-domain-containing protein [Dendryphion nanum]|uniref:Anaphase-promoting complex subunit 4 n=1 Tax=Dendryphion nanum TaxID=256645 RepID=A0A9P9IMW8_9PLEO|nr:anaphase-promoting complex, cyclosome, subunit 4-domain-containing protein [Dendryphion nanum]
MEPSSGKILLQQAEKILLHPVHPHLLAYCPTMDLIALVTDEENLDVYRINGQRAFGLKRKNSDATIDFICWEFNGQAIAVAWNDGLTDILSAETGKVIHKDLPAPSKGPTKPRIGCIGWGLNFIDVEAVKRRTGLRKKKQGDAKSETGASTISFTETTEHWDAFKDDTTLEDFLQRQPDLQTLDVAPDLPDQIAMMDMETLLPKLPAIPAPPINPFMRMFQQADSGSFSTQAQVDSLLHSHHMKDHNSVDMLIRCTDQGTVHPSIYDSLETVSITLPEAWGVRSKPLLHTNHPYSCSHGLLSEITNVKTSSTRLAFIPLTLGFIPSAGIYLHLIASKTSQLQNLLIYIRQCLQRIHTFHKQSLDLPNKFKMAISETLEERGMGNLVQHMYHLACTGHCPDVIREWLIDQLTEAGHKRWDNAVTSSLTTILQLIHENLLPALDRCTLIISRLRGLATYHDQGWIFSGPPTTFTSLLTLLKNMRLLAHTTLLYSNEQKRQFHAFSKWLRYEIDFEATEPESQSRAEMEGRDAGVDMSLVLDYIESGLEDSPMSSLLRKNEDLGSMLSKAAPPSYEDTIKAIESFQQGGTYKEEALSIDHILEHFSNGCTSLFQQITQWQESSISMDCGIVLEEGGEEAETTPLALDMRMVFESAQNDNISTYIATTTTTNPNANLSTSAPSSQTIYIHRITHTPTITTLPKSLHTYAITSLSFEPQNSTILEAKFADDKNMLVLLQTRPDKDTDTDDTANQKPKNVLLIIPYTTPTLAQKSLFGSTTPTPSSKPTSTSTSTSTSSVPPIPYHPLDASITASLLLPTGTPTPLSYRHDHVFSAEEVKKFTRHVFDARFTPLKMVVNGRKGRRVVLVLGSDRKHYRVLDLDFREEKGKGAKEGGGEGEEGEGDEEMGGG